MMNTNPLSSTILFHIGPVPFSQAVVTTWGIMILLSFGSWLLTRRLSREPGRLQAVLEAVVVGILEQITEVAGKAARSLLPLLATLFLFIATANSSGIVPGMQAPTARLESATALAAVVFVSVHYFGIRALGVFRYLRGFAKPKLIMLPLNLISEVTRTLSLTVRLFGNVMSGEFMIALVLALAGLFVPIPLMALELLLGVVQAYIFTVLAAVFIGAAINAQQQT